MTNKEALSYLKEKDHYLSLLMHIGAVLNWDTETVMPEKAIYERAEQLSLISGLAHDAETDPKLEEAVFSIDDKDLGDAEKGLLRIWKKEIKNAKATPKEFVMKLSETTSKAHPLWVEARSKNDESIFLPILEELVSLKKEEASYMGDGTYNVLLDQFEEGMTIQTLDTVFDELESSIHALMDKLSSVSVDTSILNENYESNKLREFCSLLMDKMGFDRSRGTDGIVAHPFTETLGQDDIRVSNRFLGESVMDPIFSIIHETGHALYEMNAALNPEIRGTSLSTGTSMGIHESQSRFWENLLGRSLSFWEYFYPFLSSYIPEFKNISLEDFIKVINYSHPSAIRVNADELTYSLHIILRYRIEKALFDGSLKVKDVNDAWNSESKKIVRYKVKKPSEGFLQDSHWSSGQFGYFPTYALGNLYGAMFYNKMRDDLGGQNVIDKALKNGDLNIITEWQKKNIWYYGAIYTPKELIKRVCGKELDAKPFISYLNDKFTSLYL